MERDAVVALEQSVFGDLFAIWNRKQQFRELTYERDSLK